MTESDKQNILDRIVWISQSVQIAQESGDRRSQILAQFVRDASVMAVKRGLFMVAKKQLDRARVPSIPYLDLEPGRVQIVEVKG